MATSRERSNMATTNLINDIENLHSKFGVFDKVLMMEPDRLKEFLKFRINCIQEELDETKEAFMKNDAEEVVDGLIDILVFTLGTLDLFDIAIDEAWLQVNNANMTKQLGIKEGRPNPYGLPDLLKPDGWEGPDHTYNHGLIGVALDE